MKMNYLIKKIKDSIKSFLKDPLFLRRWEDSWYSRPRNDNQLSISRTSAWRKRKSYVYKGDGFMFVEDMYTGLMPFMIYQGEREKYPASIDPSLPEKERLISQGISGRDYPRFLGDALCEFVRNAAHSLFIDGVVFYEIVHKRNDVGEIESFSLEHIPPFRLFKFLNHYYQFVLWDDAKDSRIRVQIAKIPAENILRIDFPKEYGGKRSLFNTLKRMWQLSKEITPEFYMQSMSKNENIGFNLEEYARAKYLEVAKITKRFGWNQRQYSDNYITEYYSMMRFLRGKKLEAVVRQLIISKLNEILNRPPLNLNVRVTMENLFTPEDVDKQKLALEKGDVKFMDIFNALKI